MYMLIILLVVGVVIYLVMRGKQDRPEQLGASRRGLPTGPLEPHTFACPFTKCPTCGASGDRMKQDWDGLRSVKWTCGYCGALAGAQTLRDEELPPSARRQLGLDGQMQGGYPMQPGGYGQPGGGVGGGLLTGMMIGSMMGGGHHHHDHYNEDGWDRGSSDHSSSDWGESNSGSSDWGESNSGGGSSDWGDSGGDSGGGDSGGDW